MPQAPRACSAIPLCRIGGTSVIAPRPVSSRASMFNRQPSTDRSKSGPAFRADDATGTLVRADGQSCAALPADYWESLQHALVENFGEDARDVIYRSGFEWGLRELLTAGTRLLQGTPRAKKVTLAQIDPKFVLESWWRSMSEAGHGLAKIDTSREGRGIVVIELKSCPAARTGSSSGHPVCHFYAGLFAGALSFVDRTERHATELQCRSLGHACCQFLVGPGSEVDSAEAARQQGTPAAEILRRLS
jgi:predicted hydrocarbon binding protein